MQLDTKNQETLTGVLERIIYSNEENAYCVAEFAWNRTIARRLYSAIFPAFNAEKHSN